MNEFLDDYREINRYLYIENYNLKKKKHLVFLNLPPIQTYYPNPNRIKFCKKNQEEVKKQPKISFELDMPVGKRPQFKIYGYNKEFHSEKYRFSVVKRNSNTQEKTEEEKSIRIKWSSYVPTKEIIRKMKEKEKTLDEKQKEESVEKQKRLKEREEERRKLLKIDQERFKYSNLKEVKKAAVTMQSFILRWKAKKILHKLRMNKKQRENVCKELWKTEEDYVNNLKVLKGVYINPLQRISKSKSRIISQVDFSQVFSGLEAIINLNEGLSREIKKCIFNEKGEFVHDCLLSQEINNIAPYLRMYRSYCSRYTKTLERLEKLRKNKKFSEQLEKMNQDPRTTRLGLSSYLILPIQRVPRYKLLLRDLLKYTEKNHNDYEGLNKAIQEIEDTADYLNNAMKEIEQSERVIEISNKFVETRKCTIHLPHRRFVKEDCLYKGKIKGKAPIWLHLFSDILVFSTKNKSNLFEYKFSYPILDISLFWSNDILRRKNMKINHVVLTAKSRDNRDEWLYILHKTINEFKEKKKKKKIKKPLPKRTNRKATTVDVAIYDEKERELTMTLEECLQYVKAERTPTIMLKYCANQNILGKMKLKKPHLRKFIISNDETKMCWGSPNKRPDEASISLQDVNSLVVGQTTIAFKKNPKPSVEGLSFSLLYGNGTVDRRGNWTGKTLDLICTNKREREIWARAIKFFLADRGKTTHKRLKRRTQNTGKYLKISMSEEREKEKQSFRDIGDAYSWGRGTGGALGHSEEKDLHSPRVLLHLLYLDVSQMVCGNNSSGVLLKNGKVVTWGENESGLLGHGDNHNYLEPSPVIKLKDNFIRQISFGNSHMLFLDKNGIVLGCGKNDVGQLGNCSKKKVNAPIVMVKKGELGGIVYIDAGTNHNGMVNDAGELFTWGQGSDGQLGHGIKEEVRKTPKKVTGFGGKKIKAISFGCWSSLALTDDGLVYSWGDGSFGQLGIPRKTKEQKMEELKPVLIPSLKNVYLISSGTSHCGALSNEGACYMWGSGNYGQIGNGGIRKVNYVPMKITKFYLNGRLTVFSQKEYKFADLSCGANHNLAIVEEFKLKKRKLVYGWGGGTYGRIGNNREADQKVPVEIKFFTEKDARYVCCGDYMSGVVASHQWVPDDDLDDCMKCKRLFTGFKRRHHCRNCGGMFCGKCSSKRIVILRYGFDERVRVCDNCYTILTQQH